MTKDDPNVRAAYDRLREDPDVQGLADRLDALGHELHPGKPRRVARGGRSRRRHPARQRRS